MRFVRFFLFLGIVYATAYGLALFVPAEPLSANALLGLIMVSVAAYLVAVFTLVLMKASPERLLTFVATTFSYLSIIGLMMILRTKPENSSSANAYELIAIFAIPLLVCAWKISKDDEPQRA